MCACVWCAVLCATCVLCAMCAMCCVCYVLLCLQDEGASTPQTLVDYSALYDGVVRTTLWAEVSALARYAQCVSLVVIFMAIG